VPGRPRAATAALAGTLNAVTTGVYPALGTLTLISAFGSVIIGGLGSLWGTLLGGMLPGVTQVLVSQVSGPARLVAAAAGRLPDRAGRGAQPGEGLTP
jgi:branched-chain amino acid transport system permease protein